MTNASPVVGIMLQMMWDISTTKSELYLLGKSSLFSWWRG